MIEKPNMIMWLRAKTRFDIHVFRIKNSDSLYDGILPICLCNQSTTQEISIFLLDKQSKCSFGHISGEIRQMTNDLCLIELCM